MNRNLLKFGPTWVAAVVLTATGCESSETSTPPAASRVEATVSGKVTANGKAVEQGKVTVSPPGPPFIEKVAEIQKNGSYEIKTYVGKNSFSVAGTGGSTEGAGYNKKDFDVKPGSNTIDLTLPLTDN